MSTVKVSLKKYFSSKITRIIVISFLILAPLLSMAQGPPGPGDGGDGQIPEQGVPLEGAEILLLVMGAGFVAFKVWQYNRAKNKAQSIQ